MTPACPHSGFHSGIARYLAAERRVQFVVVCDACGQEIFEVTSVAYEPRYTAGAAATAMGRPAIR